MALNTPADAKKTWCWATGQRLQTVTATPPGAPEEVTGQLCLANLCQAWEWQDASETVGYCGAGGVPYQLGGPSAAGELPEQAGFGSADITANNTEFLLWGGPTPAFPWQTTPQALEIVSTSAADSIGGTGMRQVNVILLDGSYNEVQGVIDMNGTTPVPLNTLGGPWLDVNGATIVTAGSTNQNQGTVNIQITGGGAVLDTMPPNIGLMPTAKYTIPNGRTGILKTWNVSVVESSGEQAEVSGILRARLPTGAEAYADQSPVLNDGNWRDSGVMPLPNTELVAGTSVFITGIKLSGGGSTNDATLRGKLIVQERTN